MNNDLTVFSRIPMRTWRWLGVNEARVAGPIPEKQENESLLVEAGKTEEYILTRRAGAQQNVDIRIEDGAKLHLVNIQLVPTDETATSRVKVTVGKDAEFRYTVVEAGASQAMSELDVNLAGNDSKADIWGLYFSDGSRKVDLNYTIRQAGRRTDANMQVRGAMLDTSEKIFRGTLDFIEGAKGSVGRENEEVILLSPGVRNRSVPIMLSHEDDVDGHHAVSVGRMDEDKLFYLMSRGLDLPNAQRLIVEASFNPVLDRIPDEALKQEVDEYLQGRLANHE